MLGQLEVVAEERTSTANYNTQLKQQIVKLNDLEMALSHQEDVTMLKHLVSLHESLLAQESAFKLSCKSQLLDLQSRVDALDRLDNDNSGRHPFHSFHPFFILSTHSLPIQEQIFELLQHEP